MNFLKSEGIKEPEEADILKTWYWTEKALYLLDQRKLPLVEKYVRCETVQQVRKAIKDMVVRGAPAIGICGAIGWVLGLKQFLKDLKKADLSKRKLEVFFNRMANLLVSARPTAVNLSWAVERMKKRAYEILKSFPERISKVDLEEINKFLEKEALRIWEEDLKANLKIAEYGKKILPEGGILTHCNTGALATGGYGTALGVIRKAYEEKRKICIFVDETRPFLQGARLTAWELFKLKIPFTLITDNSAGFLMKKGVIQAVIVGADRIVKNGDTANKIGTYSLAVLANFHKIPFFVVAPSSSFDLSLEKGEEIPIEKRNPKEVLTCFKSKIAPLKSRACNLAFDVTPAELITAFITEKGILYPPYEKSIEKILALENNNRNES
ncbi:MAG: S-methyl-5-thioribose-1-phosphate isomerase [Thermodesulfobacterium sp.]|nr:S-methyl-5-thioribose-1-phosphate isomerase [Thermodesulfobacterium sp.]